MPFYEYRCDPCRAIYETRHGMNDPPVETCPKCVCSVARVFSAPNLNIRQFSSPTEEKYSKLSKTEEIAREKKLQKDYERIWLPPPVKHSPWDEGA